MERSQFGVVNEVRRGRGEPSKWSVESAVRPIPARRRPSSRAVLGRPRRFSGLHMRRLLVTVASSGSLHLVALL